MKFGSGREGVTGAFANAPAAPAIVPPFTKAAAAATPKRAAIHGIAIPQIAPVNNPLLLFFVTGRTIVLFLLDYVGAVLFWILVVVEEDSLLCVC